LKTSSRKKLGIVVHAVILVRTGSENKRIMVQVGLAKMQNSISKIARQKELEVLLKCYSACLASANP
jgi:hypothetical protein